MKKRGIIFASVLGFVLAIFIILYAITTPSGGACCDMPSDTDPAVREQVYKDYLWWERKNNFKKLFGRGH